MQANHATPGAVSSNAAGHHHHTHLAIPPPAASPSRRARVQGSTSSQSLARHSRCDSSNSIASLMFELETEEGTSDAAAPALRLPSELQHLADLACGAKRSRQAAVWMDALDARAQALSEQRMAASGQVGAGDVMEDVDDYPPLDDDHHGHEQQREDDDEDVKGNADDGHVTTTMKRLPTASMLHLLKQAVSAPMPAAAGQSPDVVSAALWNGGSGLPGLSLRSVGSVRVQGTAPCAPSMAATRTDAATTVGLMGVDGAAAAAHPDSEPHVDIGRFAQILADMGHCVWVRSGVYFCPPESGMGTIRHKFVVVSAPGDTPASGQQVYYVVDPNYRSHFHLASKGPEASHYRKLLALMPSVFVGTAEQLASLVTRLGKEMEKVFLARGLSLPPWRSPRVMQGRWLVNRVVEDQHVPATPPSTPFQQQLVLHGGRTISGELRARLPALAS